VGANCWSETNRVIIELLGDRRALVGELPKDYKREKCYQGV